jgi:hypothetical protein
MAGKQAKIISREQEEDLLTFCEYTRHPQRNLVMLLLSLKPKFNSFAVITPASRAQAIDFA